MNQDETDHTVRNAVVFAAITASPFLRHIWLWVCLAMFIVGMILRANYSDVADHGGPINAALMVGLILVGGIGFLWGLVAALVNKLAHVVVDDVKDEWLSDN